MFKEHDVENIAKIVFSQNNGERIGYVLDMAVDYQTFEIKGYYVVDDETESELFLKKEDIVSVSDFAVVIDDSINLEFQSNVSKSLIGKYVFDDKGIFLGNILALKISKNKIEKIVTDRCEVSTKYVSNVGNDVVMVEFRKKNKIKKSKAFHRVDGDNIVSIQSMKKPEKISLSPRYYVGKMVDCDIFGYNNERIISKGEIISKNIVDKAKKHNRLNQLFFAIKR